MASGASDELHSLDEEKASKASLVQKVYTNTVTGSGTSLVDYRDWLPWWGYDPDVGKLADELAEQGRACSMQACVGPAIFPARLAIYLFWPTYIVATCFGMLTAECTLAHDHQVLRRFYYFAIFIRLGIEFKCLRHVTIPYVQTVGRFQWLGISIPFTLWVIIVGALSVSNMMDILLDSLFVISSSENEACGSKDAKVAAIQHLMGLAMEKMHLGFVAHVHYATWGKIIWLATITQCLYPLLEGTPSLSSQEVDYSVGSRKTKYTNCLQLETNLGSSLYQLADATCMASLSVQQPEYPKMRERMQREKHERQGDTDPMASLAFLRAALSEGMISVGLVGTLENAPQILLQSMVLSLSRMANTLHGREHGSPFETQTAISIAFSTVMCVTRLWKSGVLIAFFVEVNRAINEEGKQPQPEVQMELSLIKRYIAVLLLWVVILIACIYLTAAQLMATMITCEGQVWLPVIGCTDLK